MDGPRDPLASADSARTGRLRRARLQRGWNAHPRTESPNAVGQLANLKSLSVVSSSQAILQTELQQHPRAHRRFLVELHKGSTHL
jgi:hypothetical protein